MFYFVRAVGLLVVGAAVLAIWAVSAVANFAYGFELAEKSDWAPVFAAASAASDILKAAAIIAVVAAWKRGAYLAVIAATLIWMTTSLWSVRSGLGFAATAFSTTYETKLTEHRVAKSLSDQLNLDVATLPWLERQSAEARYKAERQSFSERARQLRDSVTKLREQVLASPALAADPVAAFLKEQFGVEERATRVATVLGFLVLLEVGSNLGFLAFGPLFWRRDQIILPSAGHHMAIAAPRIVTEALPSCPAPDVAPEPEEAAPAVPVAFPSIFPALIVDNDTAPLEETPAKAGKHGGHIEGFVAHLTAAFGTGASVWTKELQGTYAAWCREQGEAELAVWVLGGQLAKVGIARTSKKDRQGRLYYQLPDAEKGVIQQFTTRLTKREQS